MDVDVIGSAELRRVAAQVRAHGERGLGREFGTALRKASEPVQRSIRAEYRSLPARGGYSALFSRSLRFRSTLRAGGRQASFRLRTFADGTKERRDIEKLEAGQLRHPVFGRSRPGRRGERLANPWAVTRVRGQFHQRGTAGAADEAEKEMQRVVANFAARIIS